MSKNSKGISRIDSGSTHGWFVRGYKNKKTFSKLFSDKKCGGKFKALEKAKKFRNSLRKKLSKIPQKPRPRRLVLSDTRNKTGILGVSRTKRKTSSGKTAEAFSVTWRPEKGIQKCTSFSIKKYGRNRAFNLAVKFRRQKMREIYGQDVFQKIKKHVYKTLV